MNQYVAKKTGIYPQVWRVINTKTRAIVLNTHSEHAARTAADVLNAQLEPTWFQRLLAKVRKQPQPEPQADPYAYRQKIARIDRLVEEREKRGLSVR